MDWDYEFTERPEEEAERTRWHCPTCGHECPGAYIASLHQHPMDLVISDEDGDVFP